MTYEVIDDYGNVLGQYDSHEAAERELAEFAEEHPERADELALAFVDEHGETIKLVAAESIRAHAHG